MPNATDEIVQSIMSEFESAGFACQQLKIRKPTQPLFLPHIQGRAVNLNHQKKSLVSYYQFVISGDKWREFHGAIFNGVFLPDCMRRFYSAVETVENGVLLKLQFGLTHPWMRRDFNQGQLMANLCWINARLDKGGRKKSTSVGNQGFFPVLPRVGAQADVTPVNKQRGCVVQPPNRRPSRPRPTPQAAVVVPRF